MLGFVQLMFAATQDLGESAMKRAFRIENKDSSGMQISFQLPNYKLSPASLGGASYQRIEMEGASYLSASGMPELPFFSTSLAVPATGLVKVEVISSSQRVISEFTAYPVQEDFESEQPKGVILDAGYYSGGGDYPAAGLQYGDPQIMRDLRIVNIQINPFIFNAASQQLTIHEQISLKVSFTDGQGMNELSSRPM